MHVDFTGDKPIFLQIAEGIEDAVFTGAFAEETQIPSTTEISTQFTINPATVLKGMNRLVDQEILYKKRGVGLFVKQGAVDRIRQNRQDRFFESYLRPLLEEAQKLGLTKASLCEWIERSDIQ